MTLKNDKHDWKKGLLAVVMLGQWVQLLCSVIELTLHPGRPTRL